MRWNVLLLMGILWASGSGCGTFYADAARNLIEAPIRACDDMHLKKSCRQLARSAWEQYGCAHAPEGSSEHFAAGWMAGFADYLYLGGPGLPPAVPPFPYQLRRYETPEGHIAIEQWYAGFAQGSEAARASGLRESIVIPLAQPPINAVGRRSGASAPSGPAQPEAPSELPPPQRLEPPG